MIRSFIVTFLKEILTFLRLPLLVLAVLYFYTLDVYIAGAGIAVKPRNVTIGYVDYTGGGVSQKILSHFHAPEFKKPKAFLDEQSLRKAIFNKDIMVGIIFDREFATNYAQGKKATINVLLDSTAAAQSFITLSYLQNIILDFQKLRLPVELKTHKLFNQNADTHMFISLAELLSVITLLSVILTAMVFVKEKEDGTWDLMLLMPVDAKVIILAKSLSQVFINLLGTIISVGFVILWAFDTPINGSFWAFVLLSFFYILSSAGIGLFIAAVARDIMQVAQLSILIMMPIIFLSGAWTPIYAMHPILQKLSLFSPLRYYIEGTESIFFRGTPFVDLWPYFAGVTLLGIMLYYYGFKKIGKLF
ncbi:ABC-2 type transport system permease protein [Nitratiruptor sp. YY08-26]|uniref:ABC transporter permease n=1 Tax=unclassified Nitratiruptor TaxID=2624044 RepID=UPI001916BEF2|nr:MULTISPECIES: ABC transporter permease [unclassified Nitratiruptor]BCD61674.1 ABC-2 type transport system permease protein [Nitratiruptor sp. YY08-13]BCD65609.1 ABC-2 type transport system permease protein [Nitratiruptor sp. YY08-26]